ncbi:MAG: Gfo/Idh/MocA family oxidoreductase [Sedimentisphaerales bacterium]|nr:Gfo/Idh/MocA family oxidoreductase [Sedimentisphaerales bacterium]
MKTSSKPAKPSNAKVSRRDFLSRTAAATTAFTIVPRYVLGGRGNTAPSEKLNVAVIGVGGQGKHNTNALLQEADVQVSAICDVTEEADYSRFYYGGVAGRGPVKKLIDDNYKSKPATAAYPPCAVYIDFREMLEKDKGIDAVLIATPDHTHATACLAAIERGKHVYCEKPLAHSIYETRTVTEAARKAGVATQMGNHGHSSETIRLTCEWIWDGAIGDIREVHAWSQTGLDWGGFRMQRPDERQPIPAGMDWDLWIGPAPKRPYHIAYAPYSWRGWWDFGTGAIGDMACHNMDPAFWALKLGYPYSAEGSATNINDETTPFGSIVHYEFDARGDMPPVKLTWYSGGLMPPRPDELEPGRQLAGGGNGILFIGDKGKIMAEGWGGSPRIIPENKMQQYKRPSKILERSNGHHRDWVDACKGGKQPHGGFDYSGPMTEVILLGNVALRTGEKLTWNGKDMKATNCPSADKYIKPEFHNGWTI